MNEPKIIINGTELNSAECLTVRVAIFSFLANMADENVLGEDLSGEEIRQGYLKNLSHLVSLMESR